LICSSRLRPHLWEVSTVPTGFRAWNFPAAETANIRNTNFKLTANGAGGFAESTVIGQAQNLVNALFNQTLSPITYLVATNAATLSFPLSAGSDVNKQLISGNKEVFVAADGSYFIGGSTAAGGHGLVVGVKAFGAGASNASWHDFYYGAGMRFDADRSAWRPSRRVNVTSSGIWRGARGNPTACSTRLCC
jgi:hypothetical protein